MPPKPGAAGMPTLGDYLSAASFWPLFRDRDTAEPNHAPFLFWLVEQLRPASFAAPCDAGAGSYFAVCHAVAIGRFPARGLAVFEDGNAGGTARARAVNAVHFSAFSRVASRDEVPLSGVPDESLDLLCLTAGRRDAAALTREWEEWKPKLSTRAIVTVADATAPGAGSFWRGRAAEYPAFAFTHGRGHGVLAVGKDAPAALRLLGRQGDAFAADLRNAYATLSASARDAAPGEQDGELLAALQRARRLKAAWRAESEKAIALAAEIEVLKAATSASPLSQVETARRIPPAGESTAVWAERLRRLPHRLGRPFLGRGPAAEAPPATTIPGPARAEERARIDGAGPITTVVGTTPVGADQPAALVERNNTGTGPAKAGPPATIAPAPVPEKERVRIDGTGRIVTVVRTIPVGVDQPAALVELTNTGTTIWRRSGTDSLFIVPRWQALSGAFVEVRMSSIPLAADVEPGQSIRIEVLVRGPPAAGPHRLRVGLAVRDAPAPAWHPMTGAAEGQIEVVDLRRATRDRVRAVEADVDVWRKETSRWIYGRWTARYQTPGSATLEMLSTAVASWPARPEISVLVPPVSAEHAGGIAATLRSLASQTYDAWHAVLATDDAALATGGVVPASRLRLVPEGSGYADLAAAATGDVVVHVRPGDTFPAHALAMIAGAFANGADIDWLFWDSDEQIGTDDYAAPRLLAEYDPELARSTDWLVRSGAIRRSALRSLDLAETAASGLEWRVGMALAGRLPAERVRHLPFILQHRYEAPDRVAIDVAALRRHLPSDTVTPVLRPAPGGAAVAYQPTQPPLVTVVIPTRDSRDLLERCVTGILYRTRYVPIEIVIVDNGTTEPDALAYLRELGSSGQAIVLRDDEPFSWSRLNNRAAAISHGALLCFLNNDMDVLSEAWLGHLAGIALQPDVGAAGATLWLGDNRLQHGGVALEIGAPALHFGNGRSRWAPVDPLDGRTRTVTAVTGACLMTRRDVFDALGGFDETYLPIGLSDVAYCLEARRRLSLRTVVSADAELFHLESATRGKVPSPRELEIRERARRYFLNAWHDEVANEPAFSPNRNRTTGPVTIADPPRVALTQQVRRYLNPPPPKLAFVHVPKTAGVALRARLVAEYSDRGAVAFSPRTLLSAYDGDAEAIAEARRVARDADVLYSHFSFGFGELIGVQAVYATVLRDPVARVVSHHEHLTRARFGPLAGAGIGEMDVVSAIRCGLVASNLMTKMLAGERPEAIGWSEIMAAGQAAGANFAGFKLPVAVWRARPGTVPALPEVKPETDRTLLDRALANLDRHVAFATTLDALGTAVGALGQRLGWTDQRGVPPRNVGGERSPLSPEAEAAIREYNWMDAALYDELRRRGDYFISERLIAAFADCGKDDRRSA